MAFVRLHRDHEGGCGVVGAPEHQQLAYEAASQSLVLLKNDAGTLPLLATSPVRHKPTTQTHQSLFYLPCCAVVHGCGAAPLSTS